jgi:cellulose synthase/poly-beta-1,6-N-acetylglucosamine synthase-like glycosyltransferase
VDAAQLPGVLVLVPQPPALPGVDTEVLRQADGWDGDCLAEDCDLGVRLSSTGHDVAVAYEPRLATREETPPDLKALFKQRTRWNQGFLQVLAKGDWRNLPTRRQRLLARYTLSMPILQALTGIFVPVSLVAAFALDLAVPVALLTLLPLAPTVLTVLAESAALGDFGRAYGVRVRAWDHVRLALGTFPYQLLLAGASVRAVWRQWRGDGSWEKTEHVGAHRDPTGPDLVPEPRPMPVAS